METKKFKPTKKYCLRKGNLYVAWDGKSMTEKPHEGIRLSRTMAERKYPGYEMIPFPEAYNQWYQAKTGRFQGPESVRADWLRQQGILLPNWFYIEFRTAEDMDAEKIIDYWGLNEKTKVA